MFQSGAVTAARIDESGAAEATAGMLRPDIARRRGAQPKSLGARWRTFGGLYRARAVHGKHGELLRARGRTDDLKNNIKKRAKRAKVAFAVIVGS